jgi:amino acid adenylation domain-containing protein
MDTFEKLKVLEKGLAQSLNKSAKVEADAPMAGASSHPEPIAIIGMAGNFPACMTLQEFWAALDLDTSLIQETPDSRAGMSAGTTAGKYWGGFIPDVAGFDADFFNISALDANIMDPRQRLLLMSVYHCLEDACCNPGTLVGSNTGVYVAAEEDQYAQTMLQLGIDTRDGIGQSASMLANRISYHFDLRGPSESINAMCSGAAVAMHKAVSALRTGEISQAIVGAANLLLRPEPYVALERANLLNRTSTVASFGRQANGHLRSEGVISLLLKPLKQAEKDGDAIYAVIKNTAVNFNGRGGLSIGAPNPSAHASLVERCYNEAGIDPRDLGYIEAQGMGNPLSDSAEWRAFNRALESVAKKKNVTLPEQYCRISSLKPMIGHMEAASALGAVAKIIRSFQSGKIHKIVGLTEINEALETAGQACTLATSTETWNRTTQPRLAALHSFGTGGNNAHILFEEYQPTLPSPASRGRFPCIIPLSARNPAQLSAIVNNLKKHVDENPGLALEDVAFSLQTGREMMNVRLGLLVHSLAELSDVLGKLAQQDLSKPSSTIALNDVYFGCKDETELTLSLLANDEDMEKAIEAWMDKGKFGKLLSLWSKGLTINWKSLHGKGAAYSHRQKIRLPAYPFERRYHWFDADAAPTAVRKLASPHIEPETPALSNGDDPAQYLVRFLSLRLRASAEIDLDIPMNRLGINSLVLLELKRELKSEFGYACSIVHLMSDTTSIRQLAQEIKPDTSHAKQETAAIKDPASRYSLSRNQRALWFIQQLSPENNAYNISYAIHLNHATHLPALASALSQVVARHSILRARFHADELLEPHFILDASQDLPLRHIDATSWSEQEIQSCLAQEADAPFDLGREGVCRMALIETDATKENLFVFSVHHIAWDYLSFDILMKELGHFYAPGSNALSEPEELPWQYADYAHWEKQFLLGEQHTLSKQYWRNKLTGDLPTLNLPIDYPRPVVQTYRGESYSHAIDEITYDRVHALAKSRGVTPYMMLLSSFQLLLNRYTGQDDILIGLPAAGRDAAEARNLIGYFVNPVVLRIPFASSCSFDDLLRACRTEVLETLEHQQYSLEQLINDLAIERDSSRSPIFQVLVNWQSLHTTNVADNPSRMWFSQVVGTQRGAAFDITLNLMEHEGRLECQWVYNTSLFCRETIARMAQHFSSLLRSALQNPESALVNLEMLSETERQFLTRKNVVATRPPENFCLTHLFADQVRRNRDKTAVIFEEQRLSFAELDSASTQLAHHLRSRGAAHDKIVALFISPSLDIPIFLLAVQKSGAAYLPIDPNWPESRISWVLNDAKPCLILSQPELAQKLPATGIPVLCPSGGVPAGEMNELALNVTLASQTAYVIYTSGSTGKPKGVMVQHAALVNLIASMKQRPGCGENDRLLALTSLAFDIHALEIYLPLATGATLVIASAEATRSPDALIQLIEKHDISIMQQTPTTWGMMLASHWSPSKQIMVLSGGEALSETLRTALLSHPNVTLWNMYGPTETCVWSMVAHMQANTPNTPITIGAPVDNTEVYIVDQHLRQAPVGVAGELLIGGDGLAIGYINKPSLTAARFIPHPFTEKEGARLYCTGDRARFLPNGDIQFLGRIDDQIKIRGYRVELAEIEIALREHPAIQEAVVILRNTPVEQEALVAFVKFVKSDITLDDTQLRACLEEQLPSYMIPAMFLSLDTFPVSSSGKIDRVALKTRAIDRDDRLAILPEPRALSPVEEKLRSIWSEILVCRQIGITDSFFRLGGHSLLAMLVMSRVRQQFDLELPLDSIFQFPTLASFSALIERELQTQKQDKSAEIVHSAHPATLMSYAQNRIWFLDQLVPDNLTYSVPVSLEIEGGIDADILDACFKTICQRHRVLSSYYPIKGQQAYTAYREAEFKLAVFEADQDAAALSYVQKPFNLLRGPLFRAALVHSSETKSALHLCMHHIISDGWSLGILMDEITEIYDALLAQREIRLPALPIQYADYVEWQRKQFTLPSSQHQLAYWKQQLEGAPPLFHPPLDYPRPPVPAFKGASVNFDIDKALTDKLNAFAQEQDSTLFMVLLAAFGIQLARYTGGTDVVIGSPIAGRQNSQVESLIGLFLNTIVLRLDYSGAPGFTDFLGRVRKTCLDAYTHQDVPFDRLVEELQPDRNLAYSPLFQVMFVLQNQKMNPPGFGRSKSRFQRLENPTAKFDLTLSLDESEDGLHASFEYNVDLFAAASVERFGLHFHALLHTLMENPEADHFDYCALSEQDAAQLRAWNDTAIDYPKEQQLLPELFLNQARQTPDRIALTFEGEQLSYRLLNQRANRLAACLRTHGVAPDVVVGICMQRSMELVVGLLAIQKAGGAYLPLDPSYPEARLQYMMDDARITLLLTHPATAQSISSFAGTTVSLDGECIDDGQHADAAWSDDDCPNPASPEHLAYVIYTSGSTGNPKGVGNSHEAIFNRLYWMQQTFPVLEGDAVLQKTPFGFDVSVWEFFLPLLSGGRLVIAKPNGHQDPAYLVRLIREQHVTHLHFVPSMLEIFAREKNIETLDSIKYLFCSGEALSFDLRTRFLQRLPVALHNLYGPTEAAVDVTHCPCGPDEDLDLIPIGKPIANIQLHIVDPHCNLVPVGVVGELLIGGIGLARGYINRPALTAEKFIPDPFSAEPGKRLYKTGDLARYLPDGNIQYLGRIDNQVKIRGFRIELGEIENVILEHPNVVECTVIVLTNSELDKRLIAFIVTDGKPLDTLALHVWGAERMQAYMVPSAFIEIEQMPLNANGKVDRSRLIQRARDLRDTGDVEHAAPKTDQEALLTEIWRDILKLDSVSVRSDFFALGGHSLLAMQVVSRIRDVFFVELPLHVLFQNPTIEYMAAQIDSQRLARALPPIAPAADLEIPLSYAQTRFWFLDQLEGQSANYNMAIAVQFDGPLHKPALINALRSLVARHKVLRSYFASKDGMPRLGFTDRAVEIPIRQLAHLTPEARSARLDEMIAEEAKTAFSLADGDLFRTGLVQLAEESHVLMITMHHIISDGWSIGILMDDLRKYYAAYSQEAAIELPDLPIEYGDFSAWQRHYFDRDYLGQQINYWKNQLQGAPDLLQLPTDFPRPAVQSTNGSEWRFTLDKSTKVRLEALSQQEGTTLFMTLLSTFSLLLGRYSGTEDIVIGSLVAGRNQSQIEAIVGVFVNTIALRIDLSDSPDFSTLLKRVKEITLGAYSHQDVPFDRLVQELRPERNLSFSPLFQVMFVLQNAPMELLELPGLKATPLMQHNKTSKFDILFSMEENHLGMECILEYNSDLFKESTMQRFGEQFLLLVDAILDAPTACVHSHAIQTPGEKEIQAAWRAAIPSFPGQVQSLPSIFERSVQQAPESIALVLENEVLTYDQLNRRANRLAHQLRAMGVGPDFLVGIFFERSTDMIVAILAVLKAGGAYVPLDPAYPDSSIQFMIKDAALTIIVTTEPLASKLDASAGTATLLFIDQDGQHDQHRQPSQHNQATSEQNPDWEIDPDHLAYVIYTSGSTGTPKGVLVTHANVSRLFSATRPWFEFNEQDVWTLFHSYAFDFSIWEIWGAFSHGARLVIVPYMTSRSPLDFYQFLIQHNVTVLSQTPSAFRQLMNAENELEQAGETTLRYVTFGGEALDLEKLRPWLERHGDRHPQLVNMYGITETTVHVTCHPITRRDLDHPVSNIGVPIADLQVHILDKSLNPVPLGAVGQIHVAGAGLARGYLNRPELTAQRFIDYPDGLEDRELHLKLYKSGDLGRFLSDGKIEYLGRIDNQVKIRGFRIELEEIEAVLLKAENVIESVVIVVGAASEEKQLLAFVCADAPDLIDINAIRRFAGQRLPVHMVPQAYVVLDTIPLTRNGKVDRALLAKISKDKYQRVKEVEYVAPRDGLELRMCQIWEDVLQIKPIGVTDNFFDLGGHSLVAVTLMSRIAQKFNQQLPLAALFQNVTIEKLSNLLKGQNGDRYFTSLVSVNATGTKLPFFCFPGAGGSVVYLYELARQLGDDQPFYGLQAVGLDGETEPLVDVKDMAAYWLEEVLKIHPEGPFLLGGHSFGGKVAFELAQQLIRRGREVALVAVLGTTAPHPDMVPIAKNWEGARFLPELGKVMEEYLERPLGITEELLAPMSEAEQLEYVKNILIAANWLPPEIETKQFLGIVNVYKTNVSADYQPQDAVELDQLVLIKGDTEKQYWPLQNEPKWGWDRFAKQVSIHVTPGSHTSMLANPNVQSLAHYLRDCFTQVSQASTVTELL